MTNESLMEFKGNPSTILLLIPFIVGPAFWAVSLFLLAFGVVTAVSSFYYSLMIFAAAEATLSFKMPHHISFTPVFILILGPVNIEGGLRVLFTLANCITVWIIIDRLNALAKTKKREFDLKCVNGSFFPILYLAVGLSLFVSALVSFPVLYSSLPLWIFAIVAFGLAGFFYPTTKRKDYSIFIGIAYWIAILIAGIFIFIDLSPDLALVASAANLTGMYLALVKRSAVWFNSGK